jgi:rhodanese-related sulfurtransferase
MALTAMDLVAAAKQNISEIDCLVAAQELVGIKWLDVREPQEFAAGHIPGAINVARGVLEFRIDSVPEFKDARSERFVVYCQSGGRSALAVQTLQQLGFAEALSLAGGFKAWSEQGLPVE